jgi:hypothetical protein
MNWLTNLLSKVGHFFHTPTAVAIEQQIETLLPIALTIVTEINGAAPNRTLDQINAIASKYALPAVSALADGQSVGNVLLNLATEILQKNHAPTAAISTLNAVVNLAVVAVKAAAPLTAQASA